MRLGVLCPAPTEKHPQQGRILAHPLVGVRTAQNAGDQTAHEGIAGTHGIKNWCSGTTDIDGVGTLSRWCYGELTSGVVQGGTLGAGGHDYQSWTHLEPFRSHVAELNSLSIQERDVIIRGFCNVNVANEVLNFLLVGLRCALDHVAPQVGVKTPQGALLPRYREESLEGFLHLLVFQRHSPKAHVHSIEPVRLEHLLHLF
mmetsp:Transcript_81876/g.144533  ORF Transcript_81876/g.144533 Transcript_81876/m.144533 type:complete len:201 (+) Transcript_81876:321-923(+)